MTEEKAIQKSSYLFERYAMLIFIILLLVAIWFRFLPLIIVTSFLLLLSILIILWKEQSLHQVHVKLEPTKTRLFVGNDFLINVTIHNDKWIPIVWLELDFPESEFVLLGKKCEKKYILRFLWLMSYQHVKWKVSGKGFKRGVYQTEDITIRSGDGFRFTEKTKHLQTKHTLYMYPALVPVHVPPFDPSMQWEVKGSQGGFLEDPLLISGTREYEIGDHWNRLNVQATARTGKLQTNKYERITTKQLILYINVRGFAINEEKYPEEPQKQEDYEDVLREEFELLLSVLTSFAVAYHEKDVQLGYLSNGLDYLDLQQPLISPTDRLQTVLDQVAKLTEKQLSDKVNPLDKVKWTTTIQAPLFIFCRTITESDYRWYLQSKHDMSIRFYYTQTNEVAMKLGSNATHINHLLDDMVVNKG